MAAETINVRTWSKKVPSYGFRLGDLDLYVLKDHDDILRTLGYTRIEDNTFWSRHTLGVYLRWVFLLALVGGVSTLGGAILGVGGGDWTLEATPLDNDLGGSITLWCFVVVLIGVAAIAYQWLRTRRHSVGAEIAYLVATVVCGGIALGQLAFERQIDITNFAAPSIAVWAAAGAAAILLVAVVFFSRGRRVPVPKHFRAIGTPDPQQALELIAALEPQVGAKRLDERRRAIARLRDRGLIDESQAARIESLPLGTSPTIDT